MERDDLREAWASLEAQLKRTERLNDLILVESLSNRARAPLKRETVFLWVEVAMNVLGIVALGAFAGDRWGTAAGVCAAILGAVLIVINVVLTGIAIGIARLDFERPVVALQAELARIKARRAALTAAILIAGPLLWTPIAIVAFACIGVDAVKAFGVPYVAANVAFGLLVGAAAWLGARLFGSRLRKSSWTARAADVLSGNAYREAADYLDTIERYREA